MNTRSKKNKGKRLQNIVREKLIQNYNVNENDVVSTTMGVAGADIQIYGKAREKIPFSIECKNQEKLNIWQAIAQSESNSNGKIPIVVFKRNRSKIYAVIDLDNFLKIIKKDNDDGE